MPTGTVRGPLRYKVETSSPQTEAGRDFSLSITITNPYDVPAKIMGVTTRLPAKFIDAAALSREMERKRQQWKVKETTRKLLAQRFPEIDKAQDKEKGVRQIVAKGLSALFPLFSVGAVAYDVTRLVTASTLGAKPESIADVLKPEEIESAVERIQNAEDRNEAFNQIILDNLRKQLQQQEEAKAPELTLQSGNSIVNSFTLRTTQAILFAPSTYKAS
jgi:hypothetical protein